MFFKPLNFELDIDDMELTLSNLLKRGHFFRWTLVIFRLKLSVVFVLYVLKIYISYKELLTNFIFIMS